MKNIYCIVGPSGCGKTTLASALEEKFGYKSIQSYTTRLPRYDGETGYIFVSSDEFKVLGEMCAYTRFDGYEYGVTPDLIDKNDLYVIDPVGVEFLRDKYHGEKNIKVIGLTAPIDVLIARMEHRGDSKEKIIRRLANDADAFKHLDYISDIVLDTDKSTVEELCEGIKWRIEFYENLAKHEFSLLNEFGEVLEEGKRFYSYSDAFSSLLASDIYSDGLPEGWSLRDDTEVWRAKLLKEIKKARPAFKSSMINIDMSGVNKTFDGYTVAPFKYKGESYCYREYHGDAWVEENVRELPYLTGEDILKSKIDMFYKRINKIDAQLSAEYIDGETDWSARLAAGRERLESVVSYLDDALVFLKENTNKAKEKPFLVDVIKNAKDSVSDEKKDGVISTNLMR